MVAQFLPAAEPLAASPGRPEEPAAEPIPEQAVAAARSLPERWDERPELRGAASFRELRPSGQQELMAPADAQAQPEAPRV